MSPDWDEYARASWAKALVAPVRHTDARVEIVTMTGKHVADIDIDTVSVTLQGSQEAQWSAAFTFTNPDLVPTSTTSPLDGRSGLRLRVWWRLLTETDGWLETVVCTVIVEDPQMQDNGTLTGSVAGLDPLEVASRGGYRGQVIQVGGMTVDAALERLFSAIVPGFPLSLGPSAVTLPAQYELWARSPAEDWREIAAMAGQVVRTDRMGVITSAAPREGGVVVADWQEGPDCPVIDMAVSHKTSTIPRRVVVVSTNADVDPPVVGEWINPDADSMSLITTTRVESNTVTTEEAANSLARLTGERWARRQVSVEVTVPARPDLGYRDHIQLSRQQVNVAGVYEVSGWEVQLKGSKDGPGLMRVQMLTRLG